MKILFYTFFMNKFRKNEAFEALILMLRDILLIFMANEDSLKGNKYLFDQLLNLINFPLLFV